MISLTQTTLVNDAYDNGQDDIYLPSYSEVMRDQYISPSQTEPNVTLTSDQLGLHRSSLFASNKPPPSYV